MCSKTAYRDNMVIKLCKGRKQRCEDSSRSAASPVVFRFRSSVNSCSVRMQLGSKEETESQILAVASFIILDFIYLREIVRT